MTRALVSMLLASAMLSTLAAGSAVAKPKEIVVVGSSPAKTKMWAWKRNPQRVNGAIYQVGPGQRPQVGISFMRNFRKID